MAMVAVVAGVWGWSTVSHLSNRPGDFYAHPSESLRAQDEMESARGHNWVGPPNLAVLVHGGRSAVTRLKLRLKRLPQVAQVESNVLASRDGSSKLVLARLRIGVPEQDAAASVARSLESEPGVLVGGIALAKHQFSESAKHDLWRGELIALPLLLVLGLWVFRGAVAALLPVLVGCFALACTLALLRAVTEVVPLSIFSLNIASALALGLAVDYSLLMVSRFREELESGLRSRDATVRTVGTAGKTVAISSGAIATSFSALLLIPVPFVRSIAIGGMIVAVIAGAGALLILPSLFVLLGERVNALSVRPDGRSRVGGVRPGRGGWRRLGRFVVSHPVRVASVAALLLVGLSLPALGIHFTAFDETSLPTSSPLRQFTDRLRKEFKHPVVGEIRVAVHGTKLKAVEVGEELKQIASRTRAATLLPIGFRLRPRLSELRLNPRGSPYASLTTDFIDRLRRLDDPIAIGGSTAGYMDLTTALKHYLFVVLLVLALSSFIFLGVATRSLVLPLMALLMNVLSLGAAFGSLVFVFQDGRLERLLDYSSQNALVVVFPVVVGVGAFGLLTDYGLFLLMRIREVRESGRSNREAIISGLEKTGPIVTAAAVLFSAAVGAFITSGIVPAKEVAFGIVLAVLLDAFVIRPFLVPGLMAILGRWNWWPFEGFRS
ncbi:MAG TPA: MMPL family transporter [Solirubrobacterales bacterium]|nr:MMPL family transporter [Solirubrobacterales bacterium]